MFVKDSAISPSDCCFECGNTLPSIEFSGGFCTACNARMNNDMQLLCQLDDGIFFEGIND